MGALSPILRNLQGGRLAWWCPGCDEPHQVLATIRDAAVVKPDAADPDWTPPQEYYQARDGSWTWNGSASKPTFQPSVLVTHEAHPDAAEEFKEWRTKRVCHCFVVDGQMQMLGDCTNALAGQTVPIPPWPRPDWGGV